MTGKIFSLFKRGKFFYVQFKLPDSTYSTAKSTGQASRNAAERFAIEYLQHLKILYYLYPLFFMEPNTIYYSNTLILTLMRIPMKVATHSESKITTANTFSFRNYAVNQVAAFVQNYLIFPFSLNLL